MLIYDIDDFFAVFSSIACHDEKVAFVHVTVLGMSAPLQTA